MRVLASRQWHRADAAGTTLAHSAPRRARERPGSQPRVPGSNPRLDVLPVGAFDLVYTGIGALCWLPDVRRWAQVVAALLRSGGRLFLREGHPVLWSLDEKRDDGLVIGFPNFEHEVPLVCDEPGTYVDTDVKFTHTASNSWNHGLGEIVTALLHGHGPHAACRARLPPWNALPGQMSSLANGVWRVTDRPARLAHSYTLRACKA